MKRSLSESTLAADDDERAIKDIRRMVKRRKDRLDIQRCITTRDVSMLVDLLGTVEVNDLDWTGGVSLSPLLQAVRVAWIPGIVLISEWGGKCIVDVRDCILPRELIIPQPLELWTIQKVINRRYANMRLRLHKCLSLPPPLTRMVTEYAHGEFVSDRWKTRLPDEIWHRIEEFSGQRMDLLMLRCAFCAEPGN
jgi:hypothetical protein